MHALVELATTVAERLRARGETVAVAESSTGGLISAALLAVPGASAYCLGGAVIYTRRAWHAIRDFDDKLLAGARPSTEEHALFRARIIRERFAADWGIGETGAAGPTGNRYGDSAGHTCVAVAGLIERAITLETGSADRLANMQAFAVAALQLMVESLSGNKQAGTK